MKGFLFLLSTCAALIGTTYSQDCTESQTTVSGTLAPTGQLCSGQLIFEDNFEEFSLKKWQHEKTLSGGGNWEFQYYLNNRTNSFAKDGNLHIKPTYLSDDYGESFLSSGTLDINGDDPTDECTNGANYGCSRTGTADNYVNPIKSARIRTVDSFSFKYGSVVTRAKIPSGDWLWPAIWLMPRYNTYGTWPSSGEIDLLESRGNKNLVSAQGVNIGSQQMGSTLHWGPAVGSNQYMKTHWEKNNASGFDSDFHVYKVVWNPDGFIFYVDNEEIGSVSPPTGGFWELGGFAQTNVNNPWEGATKMAPFDQEFYLIINLAVGGVNYFPDDATNPGGKPWSNTSPTSAKDFWVGKSQWESTWSGDNTNFIIDYIQVYAL
ncbi:beta-1,3-glucan-binding protein-like [Sitophilus oryzae]|uniref:Beta-1,3-glucan-binding protein-like n=1 Tax=Sitophilus oryzae TaxID=7048 RepID=A0A6J2YFH1_SITOR|nr:beta-1,3-glucan-binding protein-like [Sitophilus oryzae]